MMLVDGGAGGSVGVGRNFPMSCLFSRLVRRLWNFGPLHGVGILPLKLGLPDTCNSRNLDDSAGSGSCQAILITSVFGFKFSG